MSKCWYCNNELTSGDSPKHFGICNKCYDEMFKSSDTIIRSFTNKIADLEAKLAEKDKEIEQLKKFDDLNKTFFELFRTAFKEPNKVDDLFNTLKTMQGKQHQDKISFAVEQLEKVRSDFEDRLIGSKWSELIMVAKCCNVINDVLDNQIKQLKEGVKNE